MLDLICFLLSLVFAALAVVGPQINASVDRLWLLCAAFACFVIPFLVGAVHHVG